MRKRYFVIFSAVLTELYDEAQFWSNQHGWTSLHEATVFSKMETANLHLPALGGTAARPPEPYWLELPVCMMRDPNWEEDENGPTS